MLRQLVVLLVLVWSGSGLSRESTKIVGGKEVDIKDAPFIVLIFYEDRPLCGGSILSPSFVITAAHCTESSTPRDLTIRSGSSRSGEGELFYVSKIFDHPEYDNSNFDFDCSLLKIYGRLFYNENQRAIKLPEEDDESVAGDLVRVLGWGRTMNPLESSDYLRGVDLIVIEHEECEEAYKAYGIKVAHNKVCAVHPEKIDGKDACQGDSGGPLQRLKDGKLIGIVSFGSGCAQAKFAGIYSRVSSMRTWIKEVSGV